MRGRSGSGAAVEGLPTGPRPQAGAEPGCRPRGCADAPSTRPASPPLPRAPGHRLLFRELRVHSGRGAGQASVLPALSLGPCWAFILLILSLRKVRSRTFGRHRCHLWWFCCSYPPQSLARCGLPQSCSFMLLAFAFLSVARAAFASESGSFGAEVRRPSRCPSSPPRTPSRLCPRQAHCVARALAGFPPPCASASPTPF